MSKIYNMNLEELQKQIEKFESKVEITNDRDLAFSQINEYREELIKGIAEKGNQAFFEILYMVYKHGFIQGYKQHEKESKNKKIEKDYSKEKKELLDLIDNIEEENIILHLLSHVNTINSLMNK